MIHTPCTSSPGLLALVVLFTLMGIAACEPPVEPVESGADHAHGHPDGHGHAHGHTGGGLADWAPDHSHFDHCMHPTNSNPLGRTDHVVHTHATGPDSEAQWPLVLGGTDKDSLKAMALDPEGRVIVAGEMRGEWPLGDDLMTAPVLGGDAAVAMSFEPDGAPGWGRVLGSVDGHTRVDALAVCPTGRVVVCGEKQKPLIHGDIHQEEGGNGVYIAEWKPDGTPSWLHAFEGKLADVCGAIAIEQNFDLDEVGHTVAAFEQNGALQLVRISHDGTLEYHISHGHGLTLPAVRVSTIQGLALDGQGAVWVTGMFMGGAERSVGGDAFMPEGSSAIFLAKYDLATGAHLWSGAWGSPAHYGVVGFDAATDITVIDERVIISGRSLPQVDFGGGPLGPQPDGNKNIGFLAAFDLEGAPSWSLSPTNEDTGDSSHGVGLKRTEDNHLAVLTSAYILRMDPTDGFLFAGREISPGAKAFVLDEEGMAVIGYSGYFGEITLSGHLLTGAGGSDMAIDRVEMP